MMSGHVQSGCTVHKSDQEKSAQESGEEGNSRTLGEVQFGTRRKRKVRRKPLSELFVEGTFIRGQRRVAKEVA